MEIVVIKRTKSNGKLEIFSNDTSNARTIAQFFSRFCNVGVFFLSQCNSCRYDFVNAALTKSSL